MAQVFSPQALTKLDEIRSRYPTSMAACLPVLWLAQAEFGWISNDTAALVASTLDLPIAHVFGVITFYTLFKKKPTGRYHIQVCTNVSCMLRGAYDVLAEFEKALAIGCGETTKDGTFTLDEVECLAACGTAPCVQVNDRYHEPFTPGDVAQLVEGLRVTETIRGQAGKNPVASDPAETPIESNE